MRNWLRVGLNRMGLAKVGQWLGWVVVLGAGVGAIGTGRRVVQWMNAAEAVHAQGVTTTTVQGTVYLANGTPGSGTVLVSWPAFTTAAGQQVVAGTTAVTVGVDGFLSVNLAPNAGATPAGQYYTAVLHLADGTVHTQYWLVPAAASATLASVQAQLMPSEQAIQAVSKAYVDQAIAALSGGGTGGSVPISGGTMTGPLTLCCDPTTPLMAADKHYVDQATAESAVGGWRCGGGAGDCGVGERGVRSRGRYGADDAAGYAECGRSCGRGDDGAADLYGDGHVYESGRRAGGGLARDGRAAA